MPEPIDIVSNMSQLDDVLRYKPEGRGFESRKGQWNYFYFIFLATLWPWGRLSL